MREQWIRISKSEFALNGWTMYRGAKTTDQGYFILKGSPAYENYLKLKKEGVFKNVKR